MSSDKVGSVMKPVREYFLKRMGHSFNTGDMVNLERILDNELAEMVAEASNYKEWFLAVQEELARSPLWDAVKGARVVAKYIVMENERLEAYTDTIRSEAYNEGVEAAANMVDDVPYRFNLPGAIRALRRETK